MYFRISEKREMYWFFLEKLIANTLGNQKKKAIIIFIIEEN